MTLSSPAVLARMLLARMLRSRVPADKWSEAVDVPALDDLGFARCDIELF